MCTGEVGEGPVVESSVELAVHKAAGRVEVFPGPVVATGARGAQETQGVIDNVVAGVIDNAVAGVIDNAVAGVIDNAVGKVDEGVELVDPEVVTEPFVENLEDPEEAKSRETYHQIDCRTAGGAEAILVAGGEEANEVILEADAESNCLLKLYLWLGAKKPTKLYLRLTPSRIAC